VDADLGGAELPTTTPYDTTSLIGYYGYEESEFPRYPTSARKPCLIAET
jgi:hypothetical protein